MTHTAIIKCGHCGEETLIALGHASAIACGKCDTTIILGEAPLPEDPDVQRGVQHLSGPRPGILLRTVANGGCRVACLGALHEHQPALPASDVAADLFR